jgi:threonine/homoserine/homoserine lactone efflux protein
MNGVSEIAAFLLVSIVVIVTPGQDTALTIRNSLLGGRRAGVFTALGVSSGQAVWALASAVGVVALLVASEPLFDAVKLLGAAYLVFLGLHALRNALFAPKGAAEARPEGSVRGLACSAALRQGFVSNLGNPKMAVFFTSLLPQFTAQGESLSALLAAGLVFCLLTFNWLTAYAIAVARAGNVLRRPRIRRLLDAVTGAVLVAFGLRLASER